MDHITLVCLTSFMTLFDKNAADSLLENCCSFRIKRQRTPPKWPLLLHGGIASNYSATRFIAPTCPFATTFSFPNSNITLRDTATRTTRRSSMRRRRGSQTSKMSFICKESRLYATAGASAFRPTGTMLKQTDSIIHSLIFLFVYCKI